MSVVLDSLGRYGTMVLSVFGVAIGTAGLALSFFNRRELQRRVAREQDVQRSIERIAEQEREAAKPWIEVEASRSEPGITVTAAVHNPTGLLLRLTELSILRPEHWEIVLLQATDDQTGRVPNPSRSGRSVPVTWYAGEPVRAGSSLACTVVFCVRPPADSGMDDATEIELCLKGDQIVEGGTHIELKTNFFLETQVPRSKLI